MQLTLSNGFVGTTVLLVHAVLGLYLGGYFDVRSVKLMRGQATTPIMAYFVESSSGMDTAPLPEVKLRRSTFQSDRLTQIRFVDEEQGEIGSVSAVASAPRLTESCAHTCDSSHFAETAGLTAGQRVTVVLVIEVLADGTTGSIQVIRGSGSLAIDRAAVQYALSLRWVPGTKKHQAESTRIRFPVTLSYPRPLGH